MTYSELLENSAITCPNTECRRHVAAVEIIPAGGLLGSLMPVLVVSKVLYCPSCGTSVNNRPQQLEIAAKVEKLFSRRPKGRKKEPGKVRPGRQYKHEELIKLLGHAIRPALTAARNGGEIPTTQTGTSFVYEGADVVAWLKERNKAE